MAFIEVKPEKLNVNIFNMIKNWMVLTAGDPDDCNSMIVSWGGMGIMWGRPAATVYVRNSRYTLDFMNKDEYFTLSILTETYKSEMGYLGSHSGRDGNKYAKTDLHPISFGPAVGIQEAEYVFVMRKLYNARMDRRDFKDDVIYEEWYSGKDEGNDHNLFIGEILTVYKKK